MCHCLCQYQFWHVCLSYVSGATDPTFTAQANNRTIFRVGRFLLEEHGSKRLKNITCSSIQGSSHRDFQYKVCDVNFNTQFLVFISICKFLLSFDTVCHTFEGIQIVIFGERDMYTSVIKYSVLNLQNI